MTHIQDSTSFYLRHIVTIYYLIHVSNAAAFCLNNFNELMYRNGFCIIRTLLCFFNQFFYILKRLFYYIFCIVVICYSCFSFGVSIISIRIITILLKRNYFSRIKLYRFFYGSISSFIIYSLYNLFKQ